MNGLNKYRYLLAGLIILLSTSAALLVVSGTSKPERKHFDVRARQYEYDPPVINVSHGDTVSIKLTTLDVVHGFYLEGFNINVHIFPSAPFMRLRNDNGEDAYQPIDEIVFVADKFGKFRIRCSHTCGSLHPFMQGDFIVGPNYPLYAGVGASIGILLAGCFLFMIRIPHSQKRDNP